MNDEPSLFIKKVSVDINRQFMYVDHQLQIEKDKLAMLLSERGGGISLSSDGSMFNVRTEDGIQSYPNTFGEKYVSLKKLLENM